MGLEKGDKNGVESLAEQTREAIDECIKSVLKVAKLPILAGISSGQPLGEVHMWLIC